MRREYTDPCGAFVLVNPKGDGYQVDNVKVPRSRRGEGIATRLMQEVCADADRGGHVLTLTVHEGDGLDEAGLVRWYESLGFEGTWLAMVRRPLRALPRSLSKHDAACLRRRRTGPKFRYVCSCGVTDDEVEQAFARWGSGSEAA